ncbi:MAG: rhamnulokinase, partial [Candidatus Promineifilaceae bacterium]
MMKSKTVLAVDLGAESGRVMAVHFDGTEFSLEELHRFPNEPVRLPTGLYWDMLRLWHEMLTGASVAGRGRRLQLDGIGVDCWG